MGSKRKAKGEATVKWTEDDEKHSVRLLDIVRTALRTLNRTKRRKNRASVQSAADDLLVKLKEAKAEPNEANAEDDPPISILLSSNYPIFSGESVQDPGGYSMDLMSHEDIFPVAISCCLWFVERPQDAQQVSSEQWIDQAVGAGLLRLRHQQKADLDYIRKQLDPDLVDMIQLDRLAPVVTMEKRYKTHLASTNGYFEESGTLADLIRA